MQTTDDLSPADAVRLEQYVADREAALTDRTADFLRDGERHKGGYVTPCADWIAPHEVPAHAKVCATCRAEAGVA